MPPPNKLHDFTLHWEQPGEYVYKQVLRVQGAAGVLWRRRETSHHKTVSWVILCINMARLWCPFVGSNTSPDVAVINICYQLTLKQVTLCNGPHAII